MWCYAHVKSDSDRMREHEMITFIPSTGSGQSFLLLSFYFYLSTFIFCLKRMWRCAAPRHRIATDA